jgi:hypothetical protein
MAPAALGKDGGDPTKEVAEKFEKWKLENQQKLAEGADD